MRTPRFAVERWTRRFYPIRRVVLTLTLAATCLCVRRTAAQDTAGTPIESGRSYRISSARLGESRTIEVSLPLDYATSAERYPLIVVLDGESLRE